MRIVVWDDDDNDAAAAEDTVPPGHDVMRRRSWAPRNEPTAYVAFEEEHLARYERWFPGLTVRATARLRDRPLPPGAALYLPVTYDSWVVLVDGPDAFPAALEAARWLQGVQTVATPQLPRAPPPPPPYRRWHDRILPA